LLLADKERSECTASAVDWKKAVKAAASMVKGDGMGNVYPSG
jgi:hypothetical protein